MATSEKFLVAPFTNASGKKTMPAGHIGQDIPARP